MLRKLLFFFVVVLSSSVVGAGVTVYELYPNIHTVGIMVVFDAPVSENTTSQVYYEAYEGGNWSAVKQGLELSRVTALQYAGCIFWTKPNTQYRVRTVVADSSGLLLDSTQTITTRNDPQPHTALRTFYVSPGGTGISQNQSAPGSLSQPLLDSLRAGDKVILQTGVYYVGELEIKTSGTERHPIVFEGELGAVIDGSIQTPVQWTRVSTDTAHRDYNMFYSNLGPLNTNCIIVDDKRLYPYRNLLELSTFQTIRAIDGNGFASGNYNLGLSGFFRDGRNPAANHFPYVGYNTNTYIKFADGSDTTGKSIHVSHRNFGFSADGKSNIRFSNIEFRYFGTAKLNNRRCALHFNDCDSILIDRCYFEFCDRGVVFIGNSDNNIVQHSSFFDDMGSWTYLQFKETNEDYGQLNQFYPNYFPYNYRNIEPGRVYFDRNFTGRGNMLRYNVFDGGCDGISCPVTPGDSTTSRHFDIYGNEFMNGADDAFEVDGNASNIRIWGNVVHNVGGISAASPCYGPVYVFRNVIYDLPTTDYSYIYFDIAGYHLYSEQVNASPLKLNAAFCDIPGVVYFMHNTCDVGENGRGFYLQQPQGQSSWQNVIAHNNIFYVESDDYALWVRGIDKVDLDYNCYFRTQGFKARKDRPGYGEYYTLGDASQNILGDISDSTSFIETHGYVLDPSSGWKNEAAHDYHLTPVSLMRDKGIYIPGVNDDYSELAPDLGAFELVVIWDSSYLPTPVILTDTVFTRDTIEVIQTGITDTILVSSSVTDCDSSASESTVNIDTDSSFTDTLFITKVFSYDDSLFIQCIEMAVDSFFIPDTTIGIENTEFADFTISPNPNNGVFTISLSNPAEGTEVLLFDLSGKSVPLNLEKEGGNLLVTDRGQIAPGTYLIYLKNRQISARKLIVVLQ